MKMIYGVLILLVIGCCSCWGQEDCQVWTCAATSCIPVGKCEGPNRVVITGGHCNCCQLCATLVGRNGRCGDVGRKIFACRNPLECVDGKCR